MNFHILTLFPDMVENGLKTSITGRAIESGAISVEAVDIRDYTTDKHRHVDDAPYGGAAGMVIQPAPVCDAYEALCKKLGKRPRVIYMTPRDVCLTSLLPRNWQKKKIWCFYADIMKVSMKEPWN